MNFSGIAIRWIALLGILDIPYNGVCTKVLFVWPRNSMIHWANHTKIGLVSKLFECASSQVWFYIKDAGDAATGKYLDLIIIKRNGLNNLVHNKISYRKGSILKIGSPPTASFQPASRSSRCISIHACTSFILAGGRLPLRMAPPSIAMDASYSPYS